MNKPRSYRQTLAALAVVLAGLAAAVYLLLAKPEPEPRAPEASEPPEVEVLRLRPAQMALEVETQGTVEPRREIDLVAQVSGKVVEVAKAFAAGGFFAADEVLVRIEDADYRFALVRTEARVADATQNLATERARSIQAKKEWRDLGSQDANDLFLRIPQLASAEAQLAAAIAERDKARLDLARTAISAPFAGRIRETYVDLGQFVGAGQRVARVYSTERVEVRLPLTDRQVALLDLPLSYTDDHAESWHLPVRLSAVFGREHWDWQGVITRTDAAIDVESRVLYAVAEIADPFAREPGSTRPPLSIGQFVEAHIPGRKISDVVVVPRGALQPGDRIWVVDADDRLESVPVEVLQTRGGEVAMRGAFPEELRVVYPVLPGLRSGDVVRPRPSREAEHRT